jgi:hypothetical protein
MLPTCAVSRSADDWVYDGEKFVDAYEVACPQCSGDRVRRRSCPRCHAPGGLARARTPNGWPVPPKCPSRDDKAPLRRPFRCASLRRQARRRRAARRSSTKRLSRLPRRLPRLRHGRRADLACPLCDAPAPLWVRPGAEATRSSLCARAGRRPAAGAAPAERQHEPAWARPRRTPAGPRAPAMPSRRSDRARSPCPALWWEEQLHDAPCRSPDAGPLSLTAMHPRSSPSAMMRATALHRGLRPRRARCPAGVQQHPEIRRCGRRTGRARRVDFTSSIAAAGRCAQ